MASVAEAEIESLEAIFMDDLLEIDPGTQIHICVVPFPGEENEEKVILEITFGEKYPDEAPSIEVLPLLGIGSHEARDFSDRLTQLAEENLGMEMVFTLAEGLREWLVEYHDLVSQSSKKKEKEEVKVVVEDALVSNGTPVTPEAFQNWKQAFDEEREREKQKKLSQKEDDPSKAGKLTGRQLFEQDSSLFVEEQDEQE